jgi:hypothetical protein
MVGLTQSSLNWRFKMEFMKTFEEMMDPTKIIDQVEKSTLSVLAYLQPAEFGTAMKNLAKANAEFARVNLATAKTVSELVKSSTDKFTQSLAKTTK